MKSQQTLFQQRLISLIRLLDQRRRFPDKICKGRINHYLALKIGTDSSLLSRILTGKREAMPYALSLAPVVAEAILYAPKDKVKASKEDQDRNKDKNQDDNFDWLQEYWDTFGLAEQYLNIESKNEIKFSNNFDAEVMLNLNDSGHYLARPELVTQLLLDLLYPDEQVRYRPSILAITGGPGTGKSSLAREICQRSRPFFPGGMLLANMLEDKSPRKVLLKWWSSLFSFLPPKDFDITEMAKEIYTEMDKRKRRWLCFLDNASSEFLARFPLPNTWTLVTGYGFDFERIPGDLPKLARPAPPFRLDETKALLQRRKKNWDAYNDPAKAHKINALVEGLPMAVSILAAILRKKEWDYVFDHLENRKEPPKWFQATDEGRPPAILGDVIEMAIEALQAESYETLRAAAFLAPGETFPFFYLEADDELTAWINLESALEELTQAALLESHVWMGQNGFDERMLRLHRLISIYIYSMSNEQGLIPHLNSKTFSALLQQLFLAQKIHVPILFFLPAFWMRRMTWQHLNDIVDRYEMTPKDFNTDILLYTMTLEAGRLTHSQAGPGAAVETMESLLGRPDSNTYLFNPDVFIQWVEYRLASGNYHRLKERLEKFISEYRDDPLSEIRALGCQARLAAVKGERSQALRFLQKLQRRADAYSLAFYAPVTCLEAYFAHVRANLTMKQEVADEVMGTYAEALDLFSRIVQQEPTIFMKYPSFAAALETTWEFSDALFFSDLGDLAFWMQREATRLAVSLPWIYALDHLYKYASLAWRIGFFDEAQSILHFLKKGERDCNVASCRSDILNARFMSDPTRSNQALEDLERAFNKRGLMVWRDEARKLGRLDSSWYPAQRKWLPETGMSPFAFYPLLALAQAQDQLKLPSFASDQALLPEKLPW